MSWKQSFAVVMLSAATSVASIWGINAYRQNNASIPGVPASSGLYKNTSYDESPSVTAGVDFEKAASRAVPAVVHIRTLIKAKQVSGNQEMQDNPFKQFFGDGSGDLFGNGAGPRLSPEQRGSGSGVIVSANGYIVTNNHVVDGADELLVTLNNKKDYKAKVVGRDPSIDLAVVKIEATNLPFLQFANSDDVRLGQWVLAIGYPLNLDATVTSGIISAKSRTLGINSRQSKAPVEAFIQTDAAVNPGNSGGALVNTNGEVIGINSAIASPTGSYAGYSYAIPSNMVRKTVADIMKYGSTKRAYLGIMFGNDQMTEEQRKKANIGDGAGVFVLDVASGSAADEAGVKKGDYITAINGMTVNSGTEIVEKIAALSPGDKVTLTWQHNGSEKSSSASVKGNSGAYDSVKEQVIEQLGASFENLDRNLASKLNLQSGVVVKNLAQGILTEQTRIKEGFIITKVNNTRVSSVEELKAALKAAGNTAIVSGLYPNQPNTEYQYALNDLQ